MRRPRSSGCATLPFKPGEGDDWLAARQLKIVVDGGILAGTAYMREPYGLDSRALYGVDDPAYRGFLTLTREQIASAIAIGHRARLADGGARHG